jgi:Leucine-rich repeat (LRR) protein
MSIIEQDKTEQMSDPLILDGRPFIGSSGKMYKNDEAHLIEFLGCNFNSDADRWYSLEGIEQLYNLKKIQVYGENLAIVDLIPLASLSSLEELSISGNITRLPDLTGLENLRSITITGSKLEGLDGISALNARRIEIETENALDSLAPLNNLLYLEYLNIRSKGEKTYRIAEMSNLPSLKKIILNFWGGAKIDFRGIENMTVLEELWAGWTEPFNIEGIGTLTNLKILSINLISSEPSLEFMRDMPNINAVYLHADCMAPEREYDFPARTEAYQILDVSPLTTLKNLQTLSCINFIIKNIVSLDVLNIQDYIDLIGSRLYYETEKSKHTLWFENPNG